MAASNSLIQLQYQVCPIFLTGGIASSISGSILPLLTLTNSQSGANLAGNLLPFDITNLDDAFATFTVLAGGTLVVQQVARYPFANQAVAANATIREPLAISVIMDTPMRTPDAWVRKQSVMTSLKQTLDNHNNAGGMYTVMTPAFMYDGLIMTALTDTPRSGSNPIPQNAWKFDFEKPLVTLSDATAAQNLLTSKITNGTPTNGQPGGPQPSPTPDASKAADPTNLTTENVPLPPPRPADLGSAPQGLQVPPYTGLAAAPPSSAPTYTEGAPVFTTGETF
jgi:hypothetical protein